MPFVIVQFRPAVSSTRLLTIRALTVEAVETPTAAAVVAPTAVKAVYANTENKITRKRALVIITIAPRFAIAARTDVRDVMFKFNVKNTVVV